MLRRHGDSFRARNADHLDRSALRVMVGSRRAARRRSAVMLSAATIAATPSISYNSCRNRHCPKCQAWRCTRVARRPRSRFAAGRVFPYRLHAAGGESRQSRFRTRPPVYALLFEAASANLEDDRRRSQNISALKSPPRWCCTPGGRRSRITRMSIASCRAEDCRPSGKAWIASPAAASFCRCGCCPAFNARLSH